MEPRSLAYVCQACEGRLRRGSPDACVTGVSTDSRQVRPGDLFFALRGERFDGHDFLSDADRAGAAALVIEAGVTLPSPLRAAVLQVESTRRALGKLAARYRAEFQLPVIAIAGSNGKTTTKELVAAVLSQKFRTLRSPASYNNEIGVPLTLLQLEREHDVMVQEVGTNHPGELPRLLEWVRPSHGILTSIGREHLEFFGDEEGVVREEGSLGEALPASGTLLLPGDSPWANALEARCPAACVRVGFGPSNHWQAERMALTWEGTEFDVRAPRAEYTGRYRIRLLGRHQVLNALHALAIGAYLGVAPEAVRAALAACQPPRMRLETFTVRGVRVLDDAYNANPDSMKASLETLAELPTEGRRVAVLGDMAELGEHTAAAQRKVGAWAGRLGIEVLIAVGRWAYDTARAAREAGTGQTVVYEDSETAAASIWDHLQPGDAVLIKASRAAGLERISAALREASPTA